MTASLERQRAEALRECARLREHGERSARYLAALIHLRNITSRILKRDQRKGKAA